MAHDSRRKSLGQFLPLCEKDFEIGVKKVEMSSKDESFPILLTRLVKK